MKRCAPLPPSTASASRGLCGKRFRHALGPTRATAPAGRRRARRRAASGSSRPAVPPRPHDMGPAPRPDRSSWPEVVSLDLPLTHALLRPAGACGDSAQEWMTRAVSQMFLEFMAAFARKDYKMRRARAAQGIARAKAAGVYKGRPRDEQLHARIRECLTRGMSVRGTARLLECSTSTVNRCRNTLT